MIKWLKYQWLLFLKDLGLRCHKCGGKQVKIDYWFNKCENCGELFEWDY